ncbi:MAG: hypothetical protein KDK70_01595 [Myxococcales bacterium]|nr:hypothetical protein [Myxococcales bacterium]
MGWLFGCALREAGDVVCWGDIKDPPEGSFVQLAAGRNNGVCGLRPSGEVSCWGRGGKPPKGHFGQVAGGLTHFCGIREDGSLSCWGESEFDIDRSEGPFVDVAVGRGNLCAIRADQSLSCVGYGIPGEYTPPPGTFVEVDMGNYVACAIRTTGETVCWGRSVPEEVWQARSSGELEGAERMAGTVLNQPMRQMAMPGPAGSGLAAAAGMGIGPVLERKTVENQKLLEVPPERFVSLSVGLAGACGLREDGVLSCWGELTTASACNRPGRVRSVAAGAGAGCAVSAEDGRIGCWGWDEHGQTTPPGMD